MVNMRIFKTVLECAYDLKVTRFHTKVDNFYCDNSGHSFIHRCDIKTDIGGLHITLHERHFEANKYIGAEIKTSITSFSVEDIMDLIKTQCETEAFLGYYDYERYHCECNLLKQIS